MKRDKNQTILECYNFKKTVQSQQKEFMKESSKTWEAEGLKMQEALLARMDRIDEGHKNFEEELAQNKMDV